MNADIYQPSRRWTHDEIMRIAHIATVTGILIARRDPKIADAVLAEDPTIWKRDDPVTPYYDDGQEK